MWNFRVRLPPKKTTCPVKRDPFKRNIVLQASFFFGGRVSFQGCTTNSTHLPLGVFLKVMNAETCNDPKPGVWVILSGGCRLQVLHVTGRFLKREVANSPEVKEFEDRYQWYILLFKLLCELFVTTPGSRIALMYQRDIVIYIHHSFKACFCNAFSYEAISINPCRYQNMVV